MSAMLTSFAPNGDDGLAYTFGSHAPVAMVKPGQLLRVWTADCFGGTVRTESDLPSAVVDLHRVNPVTGPFYVEGAKPGDTLALHFISIMPAEEWAVSATFPHFGALTSTHETATLQPPLPEEVWRYEIDQQAGEVSCRMDGFDEPLRLPLEPMHGTVGVAPVGGQAISTITCGAHGGNIDSPQVRAGATIYLGVNVDGALFALGDGHARQGEGEACGVAVECAMKTTLAVGLIEGIPTAVPRLETDDFLMAVGFGRPLEDAYRMGHVDLTRWLTELTSLSELDAYQLLSQTAQPRVGNVCDPAYTLVARIAKHHLPTDVAAYGGAHQRLRDLAQQSL